MQKRPWSRPDDTERLAVGVTRSDNWVFHEEIEPEALSHMCDERFEEFPVDPTVAVRDGKVSVYFASFDFNEPDTDAIKARLRAFLARHQATAKVTAESIEWPGPGYRLEVDIGAISPAVRRSVTPGTSATTRRRYFASSRVTRFHRRSRST